MDCCKTASSEVFPTLIAMPMINLFYNMECYKKIFFAELKNIKAKAVTCLLISVVLRERSPKV